MKVTGRNVAVWTGLVVVSAVLSLLFGLLRFPAALLLGPMIAAIGFGVSGASIRLPRWSFQVAQSLVGCLIAHTITGAIVATILEDWPAMLLVVATTIVSGAIVAWTLGRFGTLPASVAAWGSSPGGASAMVAMADASGADPRLVAFMQYARVVCVVVVASVVSRLIVGDADPVAPVLAAVRPTGLGAEALSVASTLAVAAAGAWLGPRSGVPAGGLLVPMVIGAILHATGTLDLTIPEPLLALTYAAIGWYVGLRFTAETLAIVWRALPQILGASLVLIALGGASAWLLIRLRHTDPLTAFLATTPGGIDSVAIISVGSNVDIAFVMALQALRVLLVILTGAPLARLIIRWSTRS